MEGLVSDVTALTSKVKAVTEQMGRAGEDFQMQMSAFLKVSGSLLPAVDSVSYDGFAVHAWNTVIV